MNTIKLFVYITLFSLIFAREAFAYIDPGTGSYLFQIIAASLLTVIFSLRNITKFIRSFIKKIISGKSGK